MLRLRHTAANEIERFAGLATGRHHDECVKGFSEQVEQLLTESGG